MIDVISTCYVLILSYLICPFKMKIFRKCSKLGLFNANLKSKSFEPPPTDIQGP